MEIPKKKTVINPRTQTLETVDVPPVNFLGLGLDEIARPVPGIGIAALPCTDMRLRYAVFVDGPFDKVHATQVYVRLVECIGESNAQVNARLQAQYEEFLRSI